MLSPPTRSPVLSALLIALLCPVFLAPVLHAEIALPDIGDSALEALTPERERQIGAAVVRNLRRANAIVDDLVIADYLNNLGYRLVAAGDGTRPDFQFFLVDDPDINAFALPGGFVGVHYGLIMAAENESELAAVVAHEVVHITQRHHARAYEAGEDNLPLTAAIIAAILLGGQGDLAQAAAASMAAQSAQEQIDFIRANEEEADRIGIGLLARSGFDPRSMAGFFQHLQRAARLQGPAVPEFLRTHPVTERRIAEASDRAASLSIPPPHDETGFHLIRTRLRVMAATDKRQLAQQLQAELENGRYLNADATRYGLVLALIDNNQLKAAGNHLHKLLKRDPNRTVYRLAEAELNLRRGQVKVALAIYADALANAPRNAIVTYAYAEALLGNNRAEKATRLLKNYLRSPTPYPVFYQLLARAESRLGHTADAYEAMAEYYYQTGQTHDALTQFSLASKVPGLDFIQVSRIEARMRAIRRELEQLPPEE
ncbi:MAG TPA: M48 family peptidase [Gammaproteobacteria bacterium]|nr:M48 family peptidase [Gammaproteobacteria bacterium]